MSKKMSTTLNTPIFKVTCLTPISKEQFEEMKHMSLTPLVKDYLKTGELPEDPIAREQVLEVVKEK